VICETRELLVPIDDACRTSPSPFPADQADAHQNSDSIRNIRVVVLEAATKE
jgi:hypothetical protein